MEQKPSLKSLAKMIDHSLLHPTMTDATIVAGCELAKKYAVATACIKPYSIQMAREVLDGSDVAVCAVDQGATIAGITEGFTGSAPDVGAFESNVAPFVPGAQRVADASRCGKIADITSSIPRQAPSPWSPAPAADAGVTDAGASSPDAGKGSMTAGGGGCGCRTIGTAGNASGMASAMAILALAGILRKRLQR